MNKGGLVIRLIDIALIILFGFIAISDINVKAQIKLPAPIKDKAEENSTEYIYIRILADEHYQIDVSGEKIEVPSIEALEFELLRLKQDYKTRQRQMLVLIAPQDETIIQATVSVMDLCNKYQIPKNIAYDYGRLEF